MKELLKKIKIFSVLNDEELACIEKYVIKKKYRPDDVIVGHDEIKKEIYIVLNGKIISTAKQHEDIERNDTRYFPGDFFGTISLFGHKPTISDYVAAEKSELLIITEKGIHECIEKDTPVAIKFISHLLNLTIQQLRESSKFLADIVQWGESASRRVITDEMTGIYNREFLEDALENFFSISKSNNKPLSLLMLDIDGYRKINEEFGFETGNQIILELVSFIRNIISKHGIIARYGGDEFSILLPEADLAKAMTIAEKIRGDVESRDFSKYQAGKNFPVTISIGISSYPETAEDLDSFKKKADASLYKAKEVGKKQDRLY